MTSSTVIATRLAMLAANPAALVAATRDRIGGSALVTLRTWIHAQDPRCVSCGFETRTDVAKSHARHAELGHLLAASLYADSNVRGGFIPGNIAIMCHTCNADAGKLDLSFSAGMLIADAFVPQEWPAQKKTKQADSDEARESRKARNW